MNERSSGENRNPREAADAVRKMMSISPGVAWGGGIVGAILGGIFGWFVFGWLCSQGFYALALPGAAVGLGFGWAARRPMIAGGIFCAIVSIPLMLMCEATYRPWVKDESYEYFFANLHQLTPMTWIFFALGVAMAFWFGRSR